MKSISHIHDFPNIKWLITLIFKNKNLSSQSCFLQKIIFCNHEAILMLFGFCKWGVLIPYLRMLSKTWTSTYNMSSWHNFKSAKQSQLVIGNLRHQTMQYKHIHFSMIQNHHRRSQSPIINIKTCNLKFQNLFSVMRPFSWHMESSCPGFPWAQPYYSAHVILPESSGSTHMYCHTHKGHFLMELQVHMQTPSSYA